MAKHFRPLIIDDIRNETADCLSVSFQVPDDWKEEFQFKAGQNVTLRSIIQGNEIRRSYSICSSPHENELRVAIKKVEQGLFSSFAHNNLKKTQVLEVLPPTGNFFLPLKKTNHKHYVAFAAGSGITPVISILKNILHDEPDSSFTLIYGNQTRASVIFREELLALKNNYPERFQFLNIFSREKTDAPIFEGRIDVAKCELIFKQLVPFTSHQEYLICGPAQMIFSIREWLQNKNVDDKNIHFELFSSPGEITGDLNKKEQNNKTPSQNKSRVTIKLDGISTDYLVPIEGPTILDFAVSAGADLPYACRAGVCATCRAKLVKGKVIMEDNFALADEELEQGFILVCQSHPASDKLTIDFDIR